MEFFTTAIQWVSNLPTIVMVPIGIFIVCLFARMPVGKAFRASVTIGAGLLGLSALVGTFAGAVSPAVRAFVESTGVQRDVTDLGVFTLTAVTWGSKIAIWFIPLGMAVNFVMLALNLTKTLDVDIQNFWVWGLSGLVVYTLTDNMLLAMVAFAINEIIILKIADWTAKPIQEHFDIDGVSIPHGSAAMFPPIAIAVNWIIDRIPVINKIEASPEAIHEKLGIIGEPVTIGTVLGFGLGMLGRIGIAGSLQVAVTVAGVLLLFPKMLGVLMDGLLPIAESIRDFMKERFKRDIYIGMDASILIGFPDVIATGLLLVPVILFMSLILPGNRVIPLADLAVSPAMRVTMCMPFLKKGNVVRGVLAGIVMFAVCLWVSGDLAPIFTAAGVASGVSVPEGTLWTSMGAGGHYIAWFFAKACNLLGFTL